MVQVTDYSTGKAPRRLAGPPGGCSVRRFWWSTLSHSCSRCDHPQGRSLRGSHPDRKPQGQATGSSWSLRTFVVDSVLRDASPPQNTGLHNPVPLNKGRVCACDLELTKGSFPGWA